jgi:hypothetical protein
VILVALAGCSPKAEVWVTPDATAVVSVDGAVWTSSSTSSSSASSVAFPKEGSHTLRIVAADRPALVGQFETHDGELSSRSGFNEIAPSGNDDALARRHPAAYLRVGNGPFTLPATGQGVVLTVDVNIGATVSLACTSVPAEQIELNTYTNLVLGQVAETDPWVRQLPAGDACTLSVGAPSRESASTQFTVVANEYTWLNAQLSQASSSGGSGWLR